ncbi:MAG: hypothetical protein H7841_05440 [Magnetospirillum sp. WYHS-4]
MGERIVFFGRNAGYGLTLSCFRELVKATRQGPHAVAATVVSDDHHGEDGTLEDLAAGAGLPILRPSGNDVDAPEFVSQVRGLSPTLGVVVQFPRIFSPELVAALGRDVLNLHRGWPLRGGSIDERAIVQGLDRYGLILHRIAGRIDGGNILARRDFPLASDETGYSIAAKADRVATDLFVDSFLPLLGGPIPEGEVQDLARTSYGAKGCLSDRIDLDRAAGDIERLIRAFHHPRKQGAGLALRWRGQDALLRVQPPATIGDAGGSPPGTVLDIDGDAATFATGQGSLTLVKAIPVAPGRLLRSWRVVPGDRIDGSESFQ